MRRMLLLASVVVFAALVASSALAQNGKGKGKPGNQGTSSTLSVVMWADYNSNGAPNWGDQITFEVATTATTQPHVQVVCFQNGDVVFGADWPLTPVLTMSSRAWQGGAADCTATAYYFNGTKNTTFASLNFTVAE